MSQIDNPTRRPGPDPARVALKTASGLVVASDRPTHAELLMQATEDGLLLDKILEVGWLRPSGFEAKASWSEMIRSALPDSL